jgi:putative endopeptidase
MRLAGFVLLAATCFAQKFTGFDPTSLKPGVDPCSNFYQYACGGWMSTNPLPGDHARYGRFDALQERNRTILQNILESASTDKPDRSVLEREIGDYYAACMDQKVIDAKGLGPAKADFDHINSIANKSQITDATAWLNHAGTTAFFRFNSAQDAKNSTQEIADVDQSGLGLPDRDYYLKDDPKSVDLRKKYLTHVARMFGLAGDPAALATKKADAVMAIELALAKGSLDNVSRRDPNKLYHKMTVKELGSLAPAFDWAKFFKEMNTPAFDSLNVDTPDFFRAMQSVITDFSLDDLKAYLAWHLLHDNADVMPKKFQDETFEFFGKALSGAKEMRPRWKQCVDLSDGQIPDALGQKFIDKTLGEAGKQRTQQMVRAIENAMEADIKALDWMTPATKEQALIKLHAIANKIGTKDHWLDYSKIKIARDDAYGNAARTGEFEVDRQLQKIGKPVDKTEWQMSQPTVNAYYDPQHNDINFPAGILQPPFWDNTLDDAVNYGAIGAVIGHELTHAFDDEGRQFDAAGNLRDWWTDKDAKAFEERAQCIVKEYADFKPVDEVHLNGELTLGENTADNGGLRLAYMALMDTLQGKQPPKRDGFTAQQRLFLGWAQVWCENRTDEAARMHAQIDPHSPGEFRVNGVVSNMPEFAQAWSCKVGQPMVKGPACRVW